MKKIYVLILVFASVLFSSCGKTTISGTLSYHFNEEMGALPDSGATVYVTQKSIEDIERFLPIGLINHSLKKYQVNYNSAARAIATTEELMERANTTQGKEMFSKQLDAAKTKLSTNENALSKIKLEFYRLVEDDKQYRKLEEAANDQYVEIKEDPATLKTTAAADGSYRLELPKGEYTLLFVSKENIRPNLPEGNGQMVIRKINAKGDMNEDVVFRLFE